MQQRSQASEAEYLRQLMANSKPHTCECGGVFFKQVFNIRSVSKIIAGTPDDAMMPIPMWRCDDCGAPVEQLQIPEGKKENPPKPSSTIITE